MRNLLAFLFKYHFFFLFILFETLSFILISNHSYYQRASIINTSNTLTGSVFESYNSVVTYFSLKKTNQQLADENASLRTRIDKISVFSDTTFHEREDTIYHQKYAYMDAKVISNSTTRRNNYLMLNKGSKHGVEADMAVITNKGVVGIIHNVSNNFCSVISILHKQMRVSARLKKNNQLGTLQWDGRNIQFGILSDIPAHVLVFVGDTVVTSGFSHIFPEGVPIGTIHDFTVKEGDNFYSIILKFTEDYNQIVFADIVKNVYLQEQRELEESSELIGD